MKYTMIVGKYINLGTLQELLFNGEKVIISDECIQEVDKGFRFLKDFRIFHTRQPATAPIAAAVIQNGLVTITRIPKFFNPSASRLPLSDSPFKICSPVDSGTASVYRFTSLIFNVTLLYSIWLS